MTRSSDPVWSTLQEYYNSLEGHFPSERSSFEAREYMYDHFYRFIDTLALIPKCPQKLRVLDIGLGRGYLAILLKKLLGYDVLGLDLETEETVFLRPVLEQHGIELRICDISKHDLPIAEESFDLVLFCEVLEHISTGVDPRTVLMKINRALRLGGLLIITTPNFARLANRVRRLAGKNVRPTPEYLAQRPPHDRHYKEYTTDECLGLLNKCDFQTTNIVFSNYQTKTTIRRTRSRSYRLLLRFYSLMQNLNSSLKDCIMIKAGKLRNSEDSEKTPSKRLNEIA